MGIIRWCMSVAYYMMFYCVMIAIFGFIQVDILGMPIEDSSGWISVVVVGLAIISVSVIQPYIVRAYQQIGNKFKSGKFVEKVK